MGRKIVITSGKGGVGKTTVTANLAYALAAAGERVVAADGDLGLNNLDVAMGIEGKISYDLFDCMEGRCRAKQALVQSPWHKNLFVMPACFGKNRKEANAAAMRSVIGDLGRIFDFVLIDCPAGVGEGFRRAVSCSEEALIVTNPHVSSLRDADKVVNLMNETHPVNVWTVVNRMRGDLAAAGEILTPREISSLLSVELIGVIPEDDGILCGAALGGKKSARAFAVLAANLIKNRRRIYDCVGAYTGFWGSIKRKLKSIL